MKHGATKQPKKTRGFSWRRGYGEENGVTGWRLFRWDSKGRMYRSEFYAMPETSRGETAVHLRRACHELRDMVDEADLKLLGVI